MHVLLTEVQFALGHCPATQYVVKGEEALSCHGEPRTFLNPF